MKKTFTKAILLTAVMLMTISYTWAQIPAGYYDALRGKKGAELKTAAFNIIKDANVLAYGSGMGYTWWGFYYTDNDNGNVIDRYSNDIRPFNGHGSSVPGTNIEHSFPKSWWGGTEVQAYKDLHHLMPSEKSINGAKGNWSMGKVQKASTDNGCTKVGASNLGFTVWEPNDKWKGDFAREVALPLIVRLPYREAQVAGTHLGAAIVGRCLLHLAHAPVAFCPINTLLAGHQVVQVFVGLHFGAAPPAFGKRVFNVSAWYRTAVAVKRSDVIRVAVNHVAVIIIGVVETPPCVAHAATVSQHIGIFNNIEGGSFQFGTLLSAQCIIIACRNLCPCITDGHEHDRCQQYSLSKCFLHKLNGLYGLVMMYCYHGAS